MIMDVLASKGLKLGRIAVALVLATALLGVSCSPAQDRDGEGDQSSLELGWTPETFTLDNGMEVVVLPDHRVPVVTHMVWYRVGAADEPPGQSGIAHFLEHLMFKGTDELGPGDFSRIVAANGGVDNAFTSWDYTAYYQRVALDRLEMVMRMEADRMTDLQIPEDEFYSERDVIKEEIRISEQDINRIMDRQMASVLWPEHPYGVPIGGWLEEAGALEPDDVMAFYSTWYAPNNAILVVAGDITAEELRPLAEEIYGAIPARAVPERRRPVDPAPIAARRLSLEHELAGQRELHRYYGAPSIRTGGLETAAALSVGMSILDGGTSEWLYRELVIERGLATTAGAYYWGTTRDDGQIAVYAVPNEGVSFDELETAMDEVIAAYLEDGPRDEQLQRTKTQTLASTIYAQDDQATMARIFGAGLAGDRTLDDILGWNGAVNAVTADDVRTALAAVLVPENSVTGTLSPKPGEPAAPAPTDAPASDEMR
jgi:zinc protease